MHEGTKYGLVALALIVIAVGIYAISERESSTTSPVATTTSQTASSTLTYENSTYGYSFEYPAQYTTDVYTPEHVSVGTAIPGGIDSVADADILFNDTGENFASFDDFVIAKAKLMCDADGPDASISCTGIATSSPIETTTGFPGEEVYLNQVTTSIPAGATTTEAKGPFYVFDLSPVQPEHIYTALVIHVPIATPVGAEDEAVITAIANSLNVGQAGVN